MIMAVGVIGMAFALLKGILSNFLYACFRYIPAIFPMIAMIIRDTCKITMLIIQYGFKGFMIIFNELNGVSRKLRKEKKRKNDEEKEKQAKRKMANKQEKDSLIAKAIENRLAYLKSQYPNCCQENFEYYAEQFRYWTNEEIKEMEEIIKEDHLNNLAI